MIGVVASRFDETSKSPERNTFRAQHPCAAGVRPLDIAGSELGDLYNFGF